MTPLRTYEVTVRNKVNKDRWTFLILGEDFADVVRNVMQTADLQEDEEVISITLDYA